MDMSSGTYRYSFDCLLPHNIPASFDGSYGHIRYYIEACLDIPWRFDKEYRVQFTVVRNDDLNEYPQLQMPCRQEEFAKFCCLFCQSDPMIMTVTIPYSGFTPGQVIPVTINFDNKSSIKVDRTKVNFKRFIRYNSHTPQHQTKTDIDKMVEAYASGVESGDTKNFTVELQVPQITMNSNDRFCNIVQITYELKVEAEISGCHQNVTMLFPIVIGTVPFGTSAQSLAQPQIQAFPSAPYYPPVAPSALIPELRKFFHKLLCSSYF